MRNRCALPATSIRFPWARYPWSADPFAADIADGKIYDRGTNDMKGGVAAFVVAEPDFSLEVYKRAISAQGTDPERDHELLRKAGLPE